MRDTVTVIHRNGQGSPDYLVLLTFEYREESGSWVGLCPELGTSAFSDSPEQARLELREAVELQLNELERLTQIQEYLLENDVPVVPIGPDPSSQAAGFALAADSR
jgi:predicted RNase H-like HicB family nuclease